MRSNRIPTQCRRILRTQSRLIKLYLLSLLALSVSIALMPTQILIRNIGSLRIYGHGLLFWCSLLSMILCNKRFKAENKHFCQVFPGSHPANSAPQPSDRWSIVLLTGAGCAWILLLFFLCFPVGALLRFILFSISIFLTQILIGYKSSAYRIYRKHRNDLIIFQTSQARRDENDENHES